MTQEQKVVADYSAAMDSVNLINAGKPEDMTDEDWADTVKRNREHLEIQISKGAEFYGEHDLTPFVEAVK